MCGSMVDIQSAAAGIRRGKKIEEEEERKKKKPQGKNIMSASATQGGHNDKTAIDWDITEAIRMNANAYLTDAVS